MILDPENTRQDLDDRLALDMHSAASRITSSVVTIHGTEDRVIPVGDASLFKAAIPGGCEVVLVEGADHSFTVPELGERAVAEVVAAVLGHPWGEVAWPSSS